MEIIGMSVLEEVISYINDANRSRDAQNILKSLCEIFSVFNVHCLKNSLYNLTMVEG
jgi:hypothetical protein